MLGNTFTKWIWDNRRSLIGWTLAIAAVGGTYASFWPSIDNPAMREALESYPPALLEALNFTDLTTPAGYLSASVYGAVAGILAIVFSISAGAKMIAGDEEAGTLDLVLAHPLSRAGLALQRFAAFLVGALAISVGMMLVIMALIRPAKLEGITAASLGAMHLHLFLFIAFFGAVAFAVGAATGRRALTIGVAAAVTVLGFVANGILPQIGWEWARGFSPFHWMSGGSPLLDGVQGRHALLMAGLVAALVTLGVWAFNRRDVAV